jgi:hypothetical protein
MQELPDTKTTIGGNTRTHGMHAGSIRGFSKKTTIGGNTRTHGMHAGSIRGFSKRNTTSVRSLKRNTSSI